MTQAITPTPDLDRSPQGASLEDALQFGAVIAVLRQSWWRILVIALATGIVTLLLLFTQRDYYRAQAVVTPTGDDSKQMGGPLGALANIGLQLGGPTKIEDLESLVRSQDLTARVFSKHDIWSETLGDSYDAATKFRKYSLFERVFMGRHNGPPTDWDAIRIASDVLKINVNKKAGTLTLSFESYTAEGVAQVVDHYLQEGKSRLQEEAIQQAQKNKAFLEHEVGRTDDALAKDRLFTLLGQEIEREMMARNREQFGFKLIDSPRVPDRKAGPHRLLISVAVTVLAALVATYAFALRALVIRRPGSK